MFLNYIFSPGSFTPKGVKNNNNTYLPTRSHQVKNRQDGKRPDGLTLILWQGGKPFIWDVTVASTLAASYADTAATVAGLVANLAADRKLAKYASHIFQPIALENLGPINSSTLAF